MRYNDRPAGPLRQLHGSDGLRERPDLIHLAQEGVAGAQINRLLHPRHVGHQQVITHDLNPITQPLHHQHPTVPVILGQPVFNADDGVLLHPVGIELNHLRASERAALLLEEIPPILIKLTGGWVERDADLLARFVARLLNSLQDDLNGLLVRLETGREAPLVPDARGVPLGLEDTLKHVIDLASPSQSLGEG